MITIIIRTIIVVTILITEKKVSLGLLCGVQHSVIMADFIMPETQQSIIVIILVIYFKEAISSSLYKQISFCCSA